MISTTLFKLLSRQKYISTVEFTDFRTCSRKTNNKMEIDWLPSANLITQIKKYIIHYDGGAERKYNSGGVTIFGLFLLISITKICINL